MSMPASGYRRDIDGLRALAVVPVVLFHAGLPGLGGGFVGVDVFFVISGFLITGILQGDLAKDRFSIVSFYDRRIRRIFPALMVVLATTTVACLLLMTPLALRAYGRELAGAALFASNLVFAAQNGYFAAAAHEKPLLHTWSLAVEEQFYIFWPIALWLAHRYARKALFTLAVAVGLASFAIAVWWTRADPGDAFYLPQTRVWELMIGAALALRPVEIKARWLRETASLSGLALIIAAIVLFDEKTPFPGPMALLPCLGAALCLIANRNGDTLGARLFSLRPVVFVGLVSYSFYLWHWPLMALARYRLMGELSAPVGLTLAAVSFLLAMATWRFVEQPFRRPTATSRERTATIVAGAAAILLVVLTGSVFYASRGLPKRAPAGVVTAERGARGKSPYATRCAAGSDAGGRCRAGAGDGGQVVIWGDSHARAFAPVVERAAAEAGLGMRLYTQSGCPPLIGVDRTGFGEEARNCRPENQAALESIAATRDLRAVVLAARWSFYTEAARMGSEEGALPYLVARQGDPMSAANSRRLMAEGLDRTLAALRRAVGPDVPIILVESAPEVGFPVPDCFARQGMWRRSTDSCERLDRAAVDARQAFPRQVLRAAAARWPNVSTYSLADRMCDARFCFTRRGETLLYVDDDHLSLNGGLTVAGDFSLGGGAARRAQ